MEETMQDILAERLTSECAAWGIGDARIAANGIARRVIEILREPTPAMIEAGNLGLAANGVDNVEDDDALACWSRMVEAALNPSPSPSKDNMT
jgi:hypothetical protein